MNNIAATVLVTLIIVLAAFLLLGIRVFFVKNGKFPNIHVGGNAALQKKGVKCASSQDGIAQTKKE